MASFPRPEARRPYRSMENLSWSYRHLLDPETPDLGPRAPQGRTGTRKDLRFFSQGLLPAGGGEERDGRRGLREKLRLQSSRSSTEQKLLPLRPRVTPSLDIRGTPSLDATVTPSLDIRVTPSLDIRVTPSLDIRGTPSLDATVTPSLDARGTPSLDAGPPSPARVSCPLEIKQEVLRRLRLRRQNSSPDLDLHGTSSSVGTRTSSYDGTRTSSSEEARTFCTADPLGGGRLHIPTFEEFKKMRRNPENLVSPASWMELRPEDGGLEGGDPEDDILGGPGGTSSGSTSSPICTGPSPRSPLKPQEKTSPGLEVEVEVEVEVERRCRRRRSSLEPSGPVPPRENGERPSSCCPALLLDGPDLHKYGQKIYQMKDGLLGSALDLIKKSCSAEISCEAAVRLSADRDPHAAAAAAAAPSDDWRLPRVAMATLTSEAGEETAAVGAGEGGGEEGAAAECLAVLGCRRSSSDAAYEPPEAVRAQRECRLRPHHSDPMPADAARRKQLEMKIAAAARLHGYRRERDSAPAVLRGRSEPVCEAGRAEECVCVCRAEQHRWSTVSSLSADSGVVGLGDDEDGEQRRGGGGGSEVERADSGIGPGLASTWRRPRSARSARRAWDQRRPCAHCGAAGERPYGEAVCARCAKLRLERKEAVLEFLTTESSYGEDLRIIREEFYQPMRSAGLLSAEQLATVFGNVQELISVNDRFTQHLQDSIDSALDQGDEDLLTVSIGEIFLEFVNMLPAFQTYCLQQSTSVNMLNALEKEKELLRIFLDASQNDNTALRRMNLRSFLMAPLQRVTKYPLLLSRIIKVTPECHPEFGRLREAKSRVESHLEHINMKTRQEGNGAAWSLRSFRRDSRKNRDVINMEMREASVKAAGWERQHTRFVLEGPLQLAQPGDGQWVKKGSRALKFQNVQSLLMVRTRRAGEGQGAEPGDAAVQDGALVLIKDKSGGKFAVLREPIRLGNCVVSMEPECEDTFEVLDIRREAFVLRAADKPRTHHWFHQLKTYARDLGSWRKRRNALPNIMIGTAQGRS